MYCSGRFGSSPGVKELWVNYNSMGLADAQVLEVLHVVEEAAIKLDMMTVLDGQ